MIKIFVESSESSNVSVHKHILNLFCGSLLFADTTSANIFFNYCPKRIL